MCLERFIHLGRCWATPYGAPGETQLPNDEMGFPAAETLSTHTRDARDARQCGLNSRRLLAGCVASNLYCSPIFHGVCYFRFLARMWGNDARFTFSLRFSVEAVLSKCYMRSYYYVIGGTTIFISRIRSP